MMQKGHACRQAGFAPIIILVGILVLALVGGVYFFKVKTPSQKACTMDAKICPDGSSVGRSGPNCEFSPCSSPKPTPAPSPAPNGAGETANWKTHTNTKYGFSFSYPNNLSINSDYTGPTLGGPITGDTEYVGTWADKSTITAPGTEASFDGLAVYVVKNVNKPFSDYINDEKQTWRKNYLEYTNQEPSNPKEELIKISQRNGMFLTGYTWSGLNLLYIPLSNNQIVVLVKDQHKDGSFDKIFNQIISTFKFLDK